VDSAHEIPKEDEAVCDRSHRGVKCGLQRQPQDKDTAPRLTGVSVALRIYLSLLVLDLRGKEKGAYCSPLVGEKEFSGNLSSLPGTAPPLSFLCFSSRFE
jgi:hypothetical protein